MYVVLGATLAFGTAATVMFQVLGDAYDYRGTVSPWVRGLLTFQPDPALMADVPLAFQLHILCALALFGLWPFTRLVHVFSAPLGYLTRPYIVYRTRDDDRLGTAPHDAAGSASSARAPLTLPTPHHPPRGETMTAEHVEILPTAPEPAGHSCGCGGHDEADPVLDVRPIPHAIRHATVFGAFDAIPPGQSLVLVAPHLPLPLIAQLRERAEIDVEVLVDGPDAWHVRLTRLA